MPFTTTDPALSKVRQGPPGYLGTARNEDKLRECVRNLLGDNIRLSEQFATGDIELYSGAPHTTTGLAYALNGRASVVSMNMAQSLAGFSDPIKSILPVGVHATNRVIVRRKYVVGGAASIVPERSSARLVSVREEEREVLLTRYGADLEMNTNLFLEPEMARQELDMKLEAQKQELEHTMVRLGYEAVMSQGTNLCHALAQTSPAAAGNPKAQMERVEKIYMHSVFGALAKYDFPIQNLLAAASRAALYLPSRAEQAVMIVPPCIAVSKFTQKSQMKFAVSGLNVAQNKVEIPLGNVLEDPGSNVKIMVHVPPASTASNTPQVTDCGLMSVASWASFYEVPVTDKSGTPVFQDIKITDFARRTTDVLSFGTYYKNADYMDASNISFASGKFQYTDSGKTIECVPVFVRPKMSCIMQSAILCTQPGSGELLMAYPQTGVSTSQTLETMRMQLRVYLGAAVYDPRHYIIIPDVAFNGIVSGADCKVFNGYKNGAINPDEHGLFVAFKTKSVDEIDVMDDVVFKATAGKHYQEYIDLKTKGVSDGQDEPEANVPLKIYQGMTMIKSSSGEWVEQSRNLGHLGDLDSPEASDILEGMQRYNARSSKK